MKRCAERCPVHSNALPDTLGARTFTAQDFASPNTDPFIENYEISFPSEAIPSTDIPLFTGVHESRQLACGPRIEFTALTAVHDVRHTAVLKQSLTLFFLIDGTPLDLAIGARAKLTLQRGQAFLITMRDFDTVFYTQRKGDTSHCLLLQTQSGDLVDPELADLAERATSATTFHRLPTAPWFSIMANATSGPAPIRRLLEESCATGLLAHALQTVTCAWPEAATPVAAGDRRKMVRVRDLLIASPEKAHRLADLAREAGVSVTTLKTKFAAVFGQPVFACLRDIRLDRAHAGIEQGQWTVSQAAYATGYHHLGSFSQAFHRKFGRLPSDLRRHG